MLVIYGIRNCSSVKKAIHFFDQRGIGYEFVDFKKQPPSLEILKLWERKCGIERVINTLGRTYKSLQLKNRNLESDSLLELAHKNPSLIKRPVLEYNGQVHFGFDKIYYESLFCA